MQHRHDKLTQATQDALTEAGLPQVKADVDATDVCYLSGDVPTTAAEALAVHIAQEHGARLVIDGLNVPGTTPPDLMRHHAVLGAEGKPKHADTPAGRILGSAHLSDRVFDASHTTLHTGTPIVNEG